LTDGGFVKLSGTGGLARAGKALADVWGRILTISPEECQTKSFGMNLLLHAIFKYLVVWKNDAKTKRIQYLAKRKSNQSFAKLCPQDVCVM